MFHSVHQLAANFFLSSVWCCSVSAQWAYKNFSTEDSCLLWKLGWWQCRDWGHKSAPQLKGTAGMIFYSSIDPHKSHTLDLSVSLYDATAGFHGCAAKPFSAMFSKMNTYSSTYKTTSRDSVLDTTTDRTSTCEGSLKGGLFSRAWSLPNNILRFESNEQQNSHEENGGAGLTGRSSQLAKGSSAEASDVSSIWKRRESPFPYDSYADLSLSSTSESLLYFTFCNVDFNRIPPLSFILSAQ